jgi:helix-turn-helix protein
MKKRVKRVSRRATAALLDTATTAPLFGCSRNRLLVRIAKGQLPPRLTVRVGGKWYFRKAVLQAWFRGELIEHDLAAKSSA